jgi:outer membrane lipoprotein carrier protein
MIGRVVALLLFAQAPLSPHLKPAHPERPDPTVTDPLLSQKSRLETAPAESEAPARPEKSLDPAVAKAVAQMQRFYEESQDFDARFEQTYLYKTFGRTQRSSGRVRFKKTGATMRWDYEKPAPKVFVVSGAKVYMHDPAAKQLTVASINTDKLSASITFLWGQGKLEREFDIAKASRKDLTDGIALELVPKIPDPRFQKVFFLIDSKSYAVKETIVVDPDGSENRMMFSGVKTNTGFGVEVFHIEPPPDTQVLRMDGAK